MNPEPMTPKRFSKIIEDIVRNKQLNYMDAVLHYCSEHELEPEDIRKFVSKTLKDKIAVNAQDLHYLPKTTAELPV
jgi:predicted RNA-binding protein with PUA-like domain